MDDQKEQSVNGLGVWAKFEGSNIPGSTRVPVREFVEALGNLNGKKILDVGSGSGRSTAAIEKEGADVVAIDLSFSGLKETKDKLKVPAVQAFAENIPFQDEAFDGINLCGVLTNLTDRDPNKAKDLRSRVIKELYRILETNGYLIISDFSAEHNLTNYSVDYRRHALITKEEGTIAVFDPSKGITFRGLSDEEVKSFSDSPYLVRFAHHYKTEELINLLKEAGFKVLKYSVEIGSTPSGNPIENIVVVSRK